MVRWSVRLLALWIALCPSITPVAAFGALARGDLAGAVLDDSGGPLPGARGEVAGSASTSVAASEGMGFFHFAGLAAGQYTVSVSHPSYATATERVTVRPGETMRISVQLRTPKDAR